jgi:hypothetical protein
VLKRAYVTYLQKPLIVKLASKSLHLPVCQPCWTFPTSETAILLLPQRSTKGDIVRDRQVAKMATRNEEKKIAGIHKK